MASSLTITVMGIYFAGGGALFVYAGQWIPASQLIIAQGILFVAFVRSRVTALTSAFQHLLRQCAEIN